MRSEHQLPRGAAQLSGVAPYLRAHGFAISIDQTITFLEAVELLGPKDMVSVYRAARVAFGPPYERIAQFDALFRAYFHGETAVSQVLAEETEQPRAFDSSEGVRGLADQGDLNPSGEEASVTEVLSLRDFSVDEAFAGLSSMRRTARRQLPHRQGFRHSAARRGETLDVRRTMRGLVRDDGDLREFRWRRRARRQRSVLLLIDVSGSMKEQTDTYMRWAHALTQIADRVECFTFGTRLTRVTRALRIKSVSLALSRASEIVADWDGGTRIGEALRAFLAVPRFAGYARGALVIILSDGLERGNPSALRDAVKKLSHRAWRITWLSPLAGDAGYVPETTALQEILPMIDRFGAARTPGQLFENALQRDAPSRRQSRPAL
ncbi:MAG: vWA domain-containing protein [Hyphomicrobiaceae bacterium]